MSEPVDETLPPSPTDGVENDEDTYTYEAFDITTQAAALSRFGMRNGLTWDFDEPDSSNWMRQVYKLLDQATGGIPLTKYMTELDSSGEGQIAALAMGHWNKPPTEEEKQTVIKVLELEPNVRTVKVKIPFYKGPEKRRNFYVHNIPVEYTARVREEMKLPEVVKWMKENLKGKETE